MSFKDKIYFIWVKNQVCLKKLAFFSYKLSKTLVLELKSKRLSNQNSIDFVCYSISCRMVKSDLTKKSIPFKSYSENSESPSKKFLINMSIFVLQRYLCYEYWAMCYEVFLMCYVSRPFKSTFWKIKFLALKNKHTFP